MPQLLGDQHKRSVSDSSTLVDTPFSSVKPDIVDTHVDENAPAAEEEEDSEEDWIDGKDYPQYVINNEKWKMATTSDLKRCIAWFFENANDETVVEGGRRVMPRVIPVSPPMTEEDRKILDKAIQGLNNAVAEGKGELHIVSAETMFMECPCLRDE